MGFVKLETKLPQGISTICKENDNNKMLMDVDILKLSPNETYEIYEQTKEVAILLIEGNIIFEYENKSEKAIRNNCFDDPASALHISKEKKVKLIANTESEILIQKTTNEKSFSSTYYNENNCTNTIIGVNRMQNTSIRLVRDIFNYNNAPYSNMVLGEVLHKPGLWSGCPAHTHPQPEVYYHRFTKEQGFGLSRVGEKAYVTSHNSATLIPGNVVHPQVSSPGYGMYYCWMIRHLENNPWNKRIDDPKHIWLHEENAEIWDGFKNWTNKYQGAHRNE